MWVQVVQSNNCQISYNCPILCLLLLGLGLAVKNTPKFSSPSLKTTQLKSFYNCPTLCLLKYPPSCLRLAVKNPKFRSPSLKTTEPKSFYYCPTLCLLLSTGPVATMTEDKSRKLVTAKVL